MSWKDLVAEEEEQKPEGWRDLVGEPADVTLSNNGEPMVDPNMGNSSWADDMPAGDDLPGTPIPQKKEESWGYGPMETFMGVMDNLRTAASAPWGVFTAGVDLIDQGIGETIGTLDENGYTAPPWMRGEDGMTSNQVADRFVNTMAGNMYMPTSPEAQAVADLIPDEVGRTAEALPPAIAPGMAAVREGNSLARRATTPDAPPIQPAADLADAVTQVGRDTVQTARNAPETAAGVYTDWRAARQARSQEAQTRDAQGILTNRWLGPEMTEVLSDASPEMKRRYADMTERSLQQRYGAKDPITGERRRTKESGASSPRDVIAEEFQMRAEELAKIGERYHQQIRAARSEMQAQDANGFRVDTTPLQTEVNNSLRKFGIAVDPKTGELDGSMATIPKKEFELINEAYQRFHRGLNNHGAGEANFQDLENLKKYLQRTAYQNSRDAGRGGDANEFIKQMSGIVNRQLRQSTDELGIGYGEANDGLSSIITVFNDMNRVIHPDSDINFFDADFNSKAMSDLARQSRGLTNNTRAGINLDETLSLMDDTLSREGGNLTPEARARLNMVDDGQGNFSIETDLRQLAVFAEHLNQLLGDGKVTSFHDLIKSATNGQGSHLANAGYNAIWGNYVGTTADLAKEVTGRWRSNRPDKVAERHDSLVEDRRKFEEYNREAVLDSLNVVLGQ